jgi:excisionase family DNA binding protein
MEELWKPADIGVNFEVSSKGRVRNVKTGRLLSGGINKDGYACFCLSENGQRRDVLGHILVMRAFAGPCPDGKQTRHLDGNPLNNCWAPGGEEETRALGGNLIYGTPKENIHDRDVVHGRNGHSGKTHCGTCGLPYDEANTYVNPAGARVCRNCVRESGRRHDEANREERTRRKRERRAVARAARPEFLTTGQAADLLEVSTETIRKWCARGILPCEQPGKHKRLRRADVERLRVSREGRNPWVWLQAVSAGGGTVTTGGTGRNGAGGNGGGGGTGLNQARGISSTGRPDAGMMS